MNEPLTGYFLGRRPYLPTMSLMEQFVEARRTNEVGDSVLLLEHEPVITLGRGAHNENLLASVSELEKLGVSVVSTGRGGDITLHAPGQLIVYPIVNLSPDRNDVRKYVRALTEVMARLVAPYGISTGTVDKLIGLWTDLADPLAWPGEAQAAAPAKLGAIGVRISRWITQHGFALNLTTDMSLYRLIIPCGIREFGVASVKSVTGHEPALRQTAELALPLISEVLGQGAHTWIDCSASTLEEVMSAARRLR